MAIDQLRPELVVQHTDESETRGGHGVIVVALTKMKSSRSITSTTKCSSHI
jgi:hypothetical protein